MSSTAKEKARELVEKFQKEIPDYLYKGEALDMAAKACAIICAEEILGCSRMVDYEFKSSLELNRSFWQSVLEELGKP
jgi:hypothetical protein